MHCHGKPIIDSLCDLFISLLMLKKIKQITIKTIRIALPVHLWRFSQCFHCGSLQPSWRTFQTIRFDTHAKKNAPMKCSHFTKHVCTFHDSTSCIPRRDKTLRDVRSKHFCCSRHHRSCHYNSTELSSAWKWRDGQIGFRNAWTDIETIEKKNCDMLLFESVSQRHISSCAHTAWH